MEQVPGKHKVSKSASEDIISTMPEDVITRILDRLPIQYAVRTSVLSRNWRFNWTLLSQVIFDEFFFDYLEGIGGENWYDENNISKILLHLKGSITKFHLYIPEGKVLDVTELDHWVLLLSRKGIKEFILRNRHEEPCMLSSNLFSCVKLERLSLSNCSLYPAPTFCGFPYLCEVTFVNLNFGEIITQCPLLEFLEVVYFVADPIGKIKMVEIAKLKNLKCLFFPLCMLDTTSLTSSLVFHLVGHFSKLQKLSLDLRKCKFIRESGAGNWVRTSLSCLGTLTLYSVDFDSEVMLSFAIEMIWGLPELQTLKIKAAYNAPVPQPALCASVFKNISMGQLQLRVIDFYPFRGSDNELWLIKNLLACSPLLKKFYIFPIRMFFCSRNEKLMFATKLSKLHRASSAAKVKIMIPNVNITGSWY
ncbi:F-box/FBD/LRR-repeat protein At1g13570-like [Rutidosis leptorrhynchoides]|uniref:F-box/FBD/LRR-repeat protein At1g13570-like n=1 Tax=Rutidosis leptorrhynchoides TaxID=125765 RepID=UPI003A99C554